MKRIRIVFWALAVIGAALSLEAQSTRKLTAPTFYIAANAKDEVGAEIIVKGATNLPPGAKLLVVVYDFIGEGGSALTEGAFPVVGQDGFFEVTLEPKDGKQFKRGEVCSIVFLPDYPQQKESVLRVVGGENGAALDPDNRNPQLRLHSGQHWYLENLIYVLYVP